MAEVHDSGPARATEHTTAQTDRTTQQRAARTEMGFQDERDFSNRLFDLRQLIGGLFTLYGLVLIVASFFVDQSRAGGVDIDLWLGIGMLLLGLFFLGWARPRPLYVEGRSASAQVEDLGAAEHVHEAEHVDQTEGRSRS
jgi:hypothetical protein